MIGKIPFILGAFVLGVLLAVQPPINAEMARHAGNPMLAATISFIVSLLIILPLVFVAGGTGFSFVSNVPWWAWLGGITGAAFVAGSLVIAPAIGVAAFFGFVVFGQLAGSAFIDHIGAFQMELRPISLERTLAIALVLSGVVLFVRATP